MSVVPTHTCVYSFGVYESCGELSAAAELVAATPGSARDDVSGRARAKMRKRMATILGPRMQKAE